MNAESSRLRSTGTTSSDMRAIWAGVLLIVYLSATAILLLIGAARVPRAALALHVLLLAGVAATTWARWVPHWLRLWAPLLVLLFLYAEIPLLIRAVGHPGVFDSTVIGWESAMFGNQPARTWASRWSSLIISETLHVAYVSYYPIIFAVPAFLYGTQRLEDFREAVFVLMLTYVVCFLCYIAFPVLGPRYLWPSPLDAIGGPIRAATRWLLDARSSAGTAFPSSHVAVAVTQSLLAMRYFGAKGLGIAVLTTGLSLGAIYGGFHYAVDVLAGAVVGAVVTFAGVLLAKWLRSRERPLRAAQANAIAPT